LRILTLTNGYPPHYYGGYELTCRDVMEDFRREGHEVTVLTSTARVPGVVDIDEPHVYRELIPYWNWEAGHEDFPPTPLGRFRVERHNLRALADAISTVRPDVVSVWHMIGLSISLLSAVEAAGIPMVITVGNEWLVEAPSYDAWTRMCRRWPMWKPRSIAGVSTQLPSLQTATINFVSKFIRQLASERSPWSVSAESPIVAPGIDLVDFPITEPAQRDWGWRVLYVGRIDPVKGVATLLKAFALLPTAAQLNVVGSGSAAYEEEMKSLADSLGIMDRVTFERCPRESLRERYVNSDVFVFPSEWDEPFGLVPIEAMACGAPVIATGTGGSREFLRDGDNCLLYKPGDADALAASLRSLSRDDELRSRLVSAGTRTASRFTMDRYSAALLDLHVGSATRRPSTQMPE
jgi:glycosyltransferase involved in cell wall biosynthesis